MTRVELDRRRFLAGLGAGTSLALAGCMGPGPRTGLRRTMGPRWSATDAFLHAYIAGKPLPGTIAAIGRGGEPPQYLTHGSSAFEGGHRVSPATLWRVYSMTKPVTGIAAMLLVEDGRLALDQNIADFLPEWSQPVVLTDPENTLDAEPARGPITVRHLLTHTAGLGYTIVTTGPLLDEYRRLGLEPAQLGPEPENEPDRRPQSLAEFSERLASLPLIAEPGTLWSYSMSLDLLGRVIEVASGMAFDDFLQRRMFDPLGMTSTFFQVPRASAGLMTANYELHEGEQRIADPAEESVYFDRPAFPFGGTGLVASAQDYDRFLAMLLGEGAAGGRRIMAAETARLAMSDLLPEGVDKSRMYAPTGFGAGGRVLTQPARTGEAAGTFGWGGAAGTTGWVDRANNLRASAYVQMMWQSDFGQGFTNAVYADLAAAAADAA